MLHKLGLHVFLALKVEERGREGERERAKGSGRGIMRKIGERKGGNTQRKSKRS
jgi:hypothetical protein